MELITALIYILLAIICVFITVSPLGCWNCLKEIKKRQKEEAEHRDRQMFAVQKSLKEISESLSFIASVISQQDDETE